jgi:alanine dehydrogenase
MKIGIPREVKAHEYRVAITPAGVRELSSAGHDVVVERSAGSGASITDADFAAAGARILGTAEDVWALADLVLKVKEPARAEYSRMRPGQVLFTYLHLAASKECTDALLDRRVISIAYETVQLADGTLPLLHPMSEVAGRLAPLMGAHAMLRASGGSGLLLGGVSGVRPAKVVVIGAGVAGMNAAAAAAGLSADVTVLERDVRKLRVLDGHYRGRIKTVAASSLEIERAVLDADLVIGAVLVPGAKAPLVVTDNVVARMRPGSVLVDISIDQGGCFEGSRPTTHDDPVFAVHDALYYCVANMPGAVPPTSTAALTSATLPYAAAIADQGWRAALAADPSLAKGLNTFGGMVTNEAVAEAHGYACVRPDEALAA